VAGIVSGAERAVRPVGVELRDDKVAVSFFESTFVAALRLAVIVHPVDHVAVPGDELRVGGGERSLRGGEFCEHPVRVQRTRNGADGVRECVRDFGKPLG